MSIAPPGFPTDETDPDSGNQPLVNTVEHESKSVHALRGRGLVASCALILVAGIIGIVVGGSGGGDTPNPSAAQTAPPAEVTGRAPASSEPAEKHATEAPAAQPRAATEIADAIKAEIPEISKVLTITEDNDPNDKIGRPGGYVDGAVMYDSRAEPLDEEPGADQGAFLEVWPDEAAATDRSEFIQDVLKSADGVLGTEYHYQHKEFLLRVTGKVTPSQAKAYERAFNAQFQDS